LRDLIARAQNGRTEIDNYAAALDTEEDHLIEVINSFVIKVNLILLSITSFLYLSP